MTDAQKSAQDALLNSQKSISDLGLDLNLTSCHDEFREHRHHFAQYRVRKS